MRDEVIKARSISLAVALGGALGAAMGAALGHMGVWVAAGIAAYIAITLAGGTWSEKSRPPKLKLRAPDGGFRASNSEN